MAIAASARTSEPAQDFPTLSPWRILQVCGSALVFGATAVYGYQSWRYELFTGHLQAGAHVVVAAREATIESVSVHPGDEIISGTRLATLADASLQKKLREQRHDVETREREVARLEAERDRRVEQEVLEIEDRIFDARMRQETLKKTLQTESLLPSFPTGSSRWPSLAKPRKETPWWKPDSPRVKIDLRDRNQIRQMVNEVPAGKSKRGDLLQSNADEVSTEAESAADRFCEERIAELQQRKQELPAKITRVMRIEEEQIRLEYARSELKALESETGELIVRASSSGRIGMFLKQAGERVSAQDPIVQIFDEESPYLVVRIPSHRVAEFAQGTDLELVFPGNQVRSGRVTEIPPQTTLRNEDGGASRETFVDVHVIPTKALWPEVPFGSQVTVRKRR